MEQLPNSIRWLCHVCGNEVVTSPRPPFVCPDCGENYDADIIPSLRKLADGICPDCNSMHDTQGDCPKCTSKYDAMSDAEYLATFPEDADLYGNGYKDNPIPPTTPTLTIDAATLAQMEQRIKELEADRDNEKRIGDSYAATLDEIQKVVGRFEDNTLASVIRLASEYNDLHEALESIRRIGFEASFDNYTWEGFDEMRWTARKALGGAK